MSQRPDQFASLFRTRAWTADELTELLGCTTDEAEGVLSAFGLEPDDENRWRPISDPVADAMQVIYEQANYAAHRYYEEWEEIFRRRLTEYLTTGEDPGYSSSEPEDDEDEIFGPGRARFERLGENRLWVRSFCRSSRLITEEQLVEASEASGLTYHPEASDHRVFCRVDRMPF